MIHEWRNDRGQLITVDVDRVDNATLALFDDTDKTGEWVKRGKTKIRSLTVDGKSYDKIKYDWRRRVLNGWSVTGVRCDISVPRRLKVDIIGFDDEAR